MGDRLITLPELLVLRAELAERGMNPAELDDELENLTVFGEATDTLASFRHELGLEVAA